MLKSAQTGGRRLNWRPSGAHILSPYLALAECYRRPLYPSIYPTNRRSPAQSTRPGWPEIKSATPLVGQSGWLAGWPARCEPSAIEAWLASEPAG